MKNLREIIAEVDNWDGTDERIGCTWFTWGEVKLLVETIRGLTPCGGDAGCDENCNENCCDKNVKLARTLDNEIKSLNNDRTINQLIDYYSGIIYENKKFALDVTWGEFMSLLMEIAKLRAEPKRLPDTYFGAGDVPPKFIRHFENGVDGGCACVECEMTRYELAEKRGYNESSWAEKKIVKLLTEIAVNTQYHPPITVKS